jgi:glycosyltransferase involved in cell wall biosynthesis
VFTGTRLDVAAILAQAAISVAPSLSEGLSNVVLESMATGVPVVATRVGGTPEMIDDGVTGFLVPPCDAPALAAAIGRLLGDQAMARRMGDAGRALAVDRFSMPYMVIQTKTLYHAFSRERGATMDEDGPPGSLTRLAAAGVAGPPAQEIARPRQPAIDVEVTSPA